MTRTTNRRARIARLVPAAVLLAILAGVAHAFTATSTVTATRRLGDGPGPISGFQISNVRYTPNPASPTFVNVVQFDLSPAPTRVVMKMVSSQTTAVNCTLSAGNTHATCTWPLTIAPTLLAIDQLRVVAVI